jgi:hypothetical protein
MRDGGVTGVPRRNARPRVQGHIRRSIGPQLFTVHKSRTRLVFGNLEDGHGGSAG